MTEEKYFFEKEVFSREDYEFTFEFDESLITELLKYKKGGLGNSGSGYRNGGQGGNGGLGRN